MTKIFRNSSCILLLVVITEKNRRQEFYHSGKVSTELNRRSEPFSVKKFLLNVPVFMTYRQRVDFRTASDRTDVAAFFGFRVQKQELFYRLHKKKTVYAGTCLYLGHPVK